MTRLRTAIGGSAAVVLAAALAACGSGAGGTGTSATTPDRAVSGGSGSGIVPEHDTLDWHSCPAKGAGVKCAMLSVPLDYAHPGGRHIKIALDMVPATAPKSQQQGILLVNPGGPGGSGLSLAEDVAQGLEPSVAAEYDIVGFDPRGVGASVPELTCDPSFVSGDRPDYIPANAAGEQTDLNRAKSYAADCEKKFGWLLPYMTTKDAARDLDQIRSAFGVTTISYYAFSYGTYLGQVYATLFPHRLRRMVLDSTVDPAGVWWADNVAQDYAFQARMRAFFTWLAKYHSSYQLGRTWRQARASWYQARERLAGNPVPGNDGKPLIGPDEFDDTYLLGGYNNALWPGLARALSAYLNQGDTRPLMTEYQQYGVQNENEFAVYNAVQCSDVNWPRNWSRWDAEARMIDKTAPFQAWDNTWYNASCAFWPVKGPSRPMTIDGKGLPGILMLQGTLDAATPYQGALAARKLLPSARMVVVSGGGNHGQSLADPPNTCVRRYLNNYLRDGSLPGGPGLVNATCVALPDPTPSS